MLRALRTTLAITALATASGSLIGCYGYASYPPIEGAKPGIDNPNAPPVDELMILSTRWVADRYPPPRKGPAVVGQAEFAINLPEGVRRDVYERVSERTGGRAVPVTEENATTLPIYHISRIWVRMHDAKVDVMRPRLDLPKRPDGQPVYECITLLVEGGFQPWRVTRFQTWEVGVVEPPPLWYCPEGYGSYSGRAPDSKAETQPSDDASEDRGVDSKGAPIPKPAEEAPLAEEPEGAE